MRRNLIDFLNRFPVDADCWSQAGDEIRELARTVRECYNDFALESNRSTVDAVDFFSITSPAEWNMKARHFILRYWHHLPDRDKELINKQIKS